MTLGDAATDVILFAGGVNTIGAGSNPSATNVFGVVRTSGDQLDFGPLTLLGNSAIDTTNSGGSVAGAALNVGAITGGGFSLGLNSGTGGAITVGGAADDISTLTITQSNGATFQSTLGGTTPGAVTITDSEDGQTVAFLGNTSITTLTTANAGYNVSFTGALTTLTNDTSFLNTGTVTLGDAATDVILFNGGVNTTGAGSNPSATNVFGVVRTSGDQLDFGPLTLLGNSTIDTTNNGGSVAGAALNVGAITGAGLTLNLNAGNANTATLGQVGAAGSALGSLTVDAATANLIADVFANAQTYNADVTLAGAANLVVASGGSLSFGQTLSAGANALTLTADEIDFIGGANTVSGNSLLTLQPVTNTVAIDVGNPTVGTGAAALEISDTDIAALVEGFSEIIIGRAMGQHTIVTGSASFKDAVTIQAPVALGSIAVTGQLDTLGSTLNNNLARITLDGPGATTTLAADVVTSGAAIDIKDSVVVDQGLSVLLNSASGAATGAVIDIEGSLDGTAGGATETLQINAGTAGAVTINSVSGSTGNTTALNLTIIDSGSTTVSGVATLLTVDLQDTTNTVSFANNLTANTLTMANAGYNVSFTGALTTLTNDTSFLNTGTVTLGDAATDVILFAGGVNTIGAGSNPSATNVFGVVRTSGDQLDFGPLTLLGNSAIDTTNSGGSVAGAALNVGAITGGGFSLGLNSGTGGAITVGGAADDISTLTITQSNGATFQSTLGGTTPGAVTITDSEDGQTVAFLGNTSITTLTTANAGYNVSFTGALTTLTNDTSFLNTGTVTLGDAATDVILFNGGVNTTGAGSNPSATNVFGVVRTSGDQLDFGPLTLLGNSTIDTTNNGGSVAGAALNLGAITGGGFSLGLNSGTGGAITVSGAADDISTLTITQSNGATFQSTLGGTTPGAVTITDSEDGQTVAFQGDTSITTLTAANAGYNVSFAGAVSTLGNDTSFLNTGTVTLGDAATDVILFDGGVNTTGAGSNPSATNVFGMVRTSGDQLDFGPLTLLGNSTIDTTNSGGGVAGAALNLGAITGGGFSLGLNSGTGGAITVSGAADGISILTITQSNGTTFQSTLGATTPGAVTITDSEDGQTVAFQGNTSITALTTVNAGYNVSISGALTTISIDTSFLNTGTVTLGDAATDVILFDGGLNTIGRGFQSVGHKRVRDGAYLGRPVGLRSADSAG